MRVLENTNITIVRNASTRNQYAFILLLAKHVAISITQFEERKRKYKVTLMQVATFQEYKHQIKYPNQYQFYETNKNITFAGCR